MEKQQTTYKKGVIRSLKGLVIKVQFDEDMPNLNEMLYVDNEKEDRRGRKLFPGTMIDIPGEGTFFIQSTKSDKEEAEQDNSESEA